MWNIYDVKNYVHIIIDSPQLKLYIYIYNEEKKKPIKITQNFICFCKVR